MEKNVKVKTLLNWLRHYAPSHLNIDEMNEMQKIPEDFISEGAKQGLLGMRIPVEYGGIELTITESLEIVEQLAAIDITLAAYVVLQHTCTFPILNYATPELRARYLPQMANGAITGCFALSEAEAGSNPRAMTTTVTPIKGGRWNINGAKCWIGNAATAGIFIVFANHSGIHKGISCFAVPSTTRGITIGPAIKTLGVQSSSLRNITFDNVEVGDENLLGEFGKGMMVAESGLMLGRLFTSAISLGIMKRSAQMMFRYASRRKVGTGLLLENPVTVSRLASLDEAIHAIHSLQQTLSTQLDAHYKVPGAALMACKIIASELAWETVDNLVQMLGARGMDECNPAAQMLRDTRFLRIGEGPTETLLMELGALLASNDIASLDYIKTHLTSEHVYEFLLSGINKIQSMIPTSLDQLSKMQWQYFNVGKLGIWSYLEASLQHELQQSTNPVLQDAMHWVKRKVNQVYDEIIITAAHSPTWNNLENISARISGYENSIGRMDDTIITQQEKLDALLQRDVTSYNFNPRVNLHTDRTQKNGAKHSSIIGDIPALALIDLAAQINHDINDILLISFAIWLARFSNQEEIVLLQYMPKKNITRAVHINLQGEPTFAELMKQFASRCIYYHKTWNTPAAAKLDLQSENINIGAEKVSISSGVSVCFCNGEITDDQALDGIDLCLIANPMHSDFVLSWLYSEVFSLENMMNRAKNLSTLLHSITVAKASVYAIPLIPNDEQIKITEMSRVNLVKQNLTDTTISAIFDNQVIATPNNIALVSPSQSLSYRELDIKVNQLANLFNDSGIEPNDTVVFLMGRTVNFIASLLAVLKMGGTILTLNVRHPKDRNQLIINKSKAKYIITEDLLKNFLPDSEAKVIVADDHYKYGHEYENNATPEAIAYITFTSGSTGFPKGVMVSHRAICNQLIWRRDTFDIQSQARMYYSAAPNFDIAIWEYFGAFAAGASIALSDDNTFTWDLKKTIEIIHRFQITHIQISPTQLILVLSDQDVGKCNSLKCVFSGGELMPKQVQKLFAENLSGELVHVYGSTEAAIDVAFWRCTPNNSNSATYIGHPFANKCIYVLDKHLQMVPIGVPGELYIGGQDLGEGYIGQAELTNSCFLPDPFAKSPNSRMYRSGDKVRFVSNGALEFLGRIDQQLKINGVRIEPGEIDNILETHPDIKQLRVAAKETKKEKGKLILVAYYVSYTGKIVDEKQLRTFANKHLPKEMIPSRFVHLEALPLTSTDKLDIRALPEIDSSPSKDKLVTSDTTMQAVLNVWEELLDIVVPDEVSDFFELGGHSLTAVQALTRVREIFAVDISINDFFEDPTLKSLTEKIKVAQHAGNKLVYHDPIISTRDDHIPLSGTQENLWYLNKLNPKSSAYNCPEAVRLHGFLNIDALESAVSTILSRHESLRTLIKEENGHPKQVLLPEAIFELPIVDFSNMVIDEREQCLLKAIEEEAMLPFKLETERLFKAKIFKISENDHVFFWNFHHIIADGWSSASIFPAELCELYSAKVEQRQAQLPSIKIQPIDYMHWQKKYLSESKLNQQREFWKKELSGAPAEIDLSLGHPQPAKPSEHSCRVFIEFPDELLSSMRYFSQQNNLTSFDILMTAFSTLAHILTREDDICIGTVVAGRKHSSIEKVIGNFANVVVVRSHFSDDPTLYTLLGNLREKMLNILDHSDIPFEDVVSVIHPNRKRYKNPLFNVFLSLYNGSVKDLSMTDLNQSVIHCDQKVAHFDLSIALFESKNSLKGYIEYKTDLFANETVKRIAQYYVRMVQALVHNTRLHLSEVSLVDERERNLLVNTWNDFYSEFPREHCLHQLFENQVQRVPQNIAVTFADQSLTYAQLNQKANQVANHLRNLNVKTGDLVGMCVKPSIEMIVGLLGIVKAGAAYVPLDPELPIARINFIIDEIKASVILSQANLTDRVSQSTAKIVCLDSDWPIIAKYNDNNLNIVLGSHSPIYMIFTSGSTGKPKGVRTLHYNVAALICNTNHMQTVETDVFAKVNNFAFDISTWEIWTPLVIGASIIGIPEEIKFSPHIFAEFIYKKGITMLYLPTALFHSISAEIPSAFGSLRLLVVGGEALDPNRAREVLANNPPQGFINAYGPTEVTCNSAWYDVKKLPPSAIRVPIGRPISNTQFYVLSPKLQLLPIGAKSELYIAGAGVSKGYLERAELTEKHFLQNPFKHEDEFPRLYRTGDLVRYLSDGNLEFLGRVDHQVKIRGFRIEIGEIESTLRRHEAIREVIILVREDESNNKRLVAFIAFHVECLTPSIEELRNFLKEYLPIYMVPSIFIILDALPLNTNAKVDRSKLMQMEISADNSSKQETYPRNEFEVRLIRIWEDILGLRNPSIRTNFFEAGGDSLRAVQLLSAIKNEFSKLLPLELLYEEGSIESLAVHLKSNNIRPTGSVLVKLYKDSSGASPLFLVHPLSGSVMCYNPLARMLQYPLFGLQSASLETDTKPIETIEKMASQYLASLLKVQKTGPYFLGGWSFGGVVAYEMAQQLEDMGHVVSDIILFDSAAPDKAQKALDLGAILKLCLEEVVEQFAAKITLDFDGFDTHDSETLLQMVLQQVKTCGAYPPDTQVDTLKRMVDVCLANAKAINQYKQTRRVKSTITLYRAEDFARMQSMLIDPNSIQEPCLGWSALTHENISVHTVKGNHMSMLFNPNLQLLVPKLKNQIQGITKACKQEFHEYSL